MLGFNGQRIISMEDLGALAIASAVNSIVGETETLISKPGVEDVLVLMADKGGWRVRIGDYVAKTFTAATTDIITDADHGYTTGDGPYEMTNAGGALPAGLAVSTDYFIVSLDDDTYSVALTLALAQAGTVVDITDTGTGTHTIAGMPSVEMPATTISNGHGAMFLGEGAGVPLPSPNSITVRGYAATSVLTYFWL